MRPLYVNANIQKYTQKQTSVASFLFNACINAHPLSFVLDMHSYTFSLCLSACHTLPCSILSFYSKSIDSSVYTGTGICTVLSILIEYYAYILCYCIKTLYTHKKYISKRQCSVFPLSWIFSPFVFLFLRRVSEQCLGPAGDLMECVFSRLWESTPCC